MCLFGDIVFGPRSAAALHDAPIAGSVVACDVVWAEVAGWTGSETGYRERCDDLGVTYLPVASRGRGRRGRDVGAVSGRRRAA